MSADVLMTARPRFPLSSLSPPSGLKGALTGEIYKLELDGTIVGSLGRIDNARGTFMTPHFIDCTRENELIAVGISDWMQTITLLPR